MSQQSNNQERPQLKSITEYLQDIEYYNAKLLQLDLSDPNKVKEQLFDINVAISEAIHKIYRVIESYAFRRNYSKSRYYRKTPQNQSSKGYGKRTYGGGKWRRYGK